LFIGNRKTTSKKFKAKEISGIDYIPYITVPKSITYGNASRMYYLFFSDKYKSIFEKNIRRGKKYLLNNE